MLELNKIYNMDCREGLKKLDRKIDLTITSPPYYGYKDLYTKNQSDKIQSEKSIDLYNKKLKEIFTIIYKKTKEGGFCVIIYGDNLKITKPYNEISNVSNIVCFMQEIGWKKITTKIWHKKVNPLIFNIINFKKTLSGRFRSLKEYEYILVFYKGELSINSKLEIAYFKDKEDLFLHSDLTLKEFKDWVPKQIWKIDEKNECWKLVIRNNKEKRIEDIKYNRYHPFQLPLSLIYRIIKIYSQKYEDCLILDPFAGVGTTCIVASLLKRNFIGFEIERKFVDYYEKIKDRIIKVVGGQGTLLNLIKKNV